MLNNAHKARCRPSNWPALDRQYGEPVQANWWMPDSPGAFNNQHKGARVCLEDGGCPIRQECEDASGGFGLWGGIAFGLADKARITAREHGVEWRFEGDAKSRPEQMFIRPETRD